MNFVFHSHLFDRISLQDSQVFVGFVICELPNQDKIRTILSWFGSSLPSIRCRLPLFITSMAHFPMLNSIPMSWLYILTVRIRVSRCFSFFANSLMSSMYIRWLIFSFDLQSLYLSVHFLSIWLRGIMAIMNSKGDSASPWEIPLWIFVSAKVFSCCCQFNSPGFHGFLDEVYDFMWYFVHFETVYYPALRNHIVCLIIIRYIPILSALSVKPHASNMKTIPASILF